MNPTNPGRRLSGLCAVILAFTLTGCPLLDPPEPLKPLLTEKEDKLAFKVDKEKNSVCRITKDFGNGQFVYDHRGRLYQYLGYSSKTTFHYDAQDYLVAQDFVYTFPFAPRGVRWHYSYDGGLISRVDRYVEKNGQIILEDQVLFESGRHKTYVVIYEDQTFEIVFNTNESGRVTGFVTNAESSTGEMITYTMEYDSRGNRIKSYTNSPDIGESETRFSDIPNPVYDLLQFKGHSYAKHLNYFDGNLYSLGDLSPDLPVYQKVITSSWTAVNFEYTYGEDLNHAGYPLSRVFPSTNIVQKAEYENCDLASGYNSGIQSFK